MAGKPYRQGDLALMARMRDERIPISVIASRLGRTAAGIQGALRARGLVDPARSRVMSSVRVLTAEQRTVFEHFVCVHPANCTASDIRDEWNREAVIKGWPTVTSDRVYRCRRKLGLQPTRSERLQFETYRRKQRASQTARRAKERKTRREALRSQRSEIYATGVELLRRKCRVCLETWPLTEKFYYHAGDDKKYYLNTCKLCDYAATATTAEERRFHRFEVYDRQVAVTQISHAKCERDFFLRQHRSFPTQRCFRCHETWELLPIRYQVYKGRSGTELYRKTCRFCLRAAARSKDRAKMALVRAHHPTVVVDSPCGSLRAGVD